MSSVNLRPDGHPVPIFSATAGSSLGPSWTVSGESLDRVATGHYAVTETGADGLTRIRRSPDPVKDQTYFLSHLSQAQAALAMFPIGNLHKSEVRRMAQDWQLPNRDRKDSQGICFLGKIKYVDFIRHHLGEREGSIIESKTGRILGPHQGYWFYTIGQRTGLGLSGGPWYVVARNPQDNTVTVARNPAAIDAARTQFTVTVANWIADVPEFPARVTIKLRHGPKLIPGCVEKFYAADGPKSRLRITLDEPDRGIAPGQFSVFYSGDVCLGGAMVSE